MIRSRSHARERALTLGVYLVKPQAMMPNPRVAFMQQIEEVKKHMGELRSADGKSVERLLSDRAQQPITSSTKKK